MCVTNRTGLLIVFFVVIFTYSNRVIARKLKRASQLSRRTHAERLLRRSHLTLMFLVFQSSYCAKVRALVPTFSTNSRGKLAKQATPNINVSGLLQKDLFKGKVKFGEQLFQTTLLSRFSHKVCRLLSSPVPLRKLTNVK